MSCKLNKYLSNLVASENFWRLIPIIVSVVALIISCRSCMITKERLNYQINHDKWKDTPALEDVKDSTEIKFSLKGDNATLQSLYMTLPDEISRQRWESRLTYPFSFNKQSLEYLVLNVLRKHVEVKDSIEQVITIGVPAIMDYNAVVNSSASWLREFRVLRFIVCLSSDYESSEYIGSILLSSVDSPLQSDVSSIEELQEIMKLDSIGIKRMLNKRFDINLSDLKKP